MPCCRSSPIFRGADWMERECYDMFGIRFDGHPDLRRILLVRRLGGPPPPQVLRGRHAAPALPMTLRISRPRATVAEESRRAARHGARDGYGGSERLTMNMGPQHPSAHGVFRAILTLEGETVVGVDAGDRLPPPLPREAVGRR